MHIGFRKSFLVALAVLGLAAPPAVCGLKEFETHTEAALKAFEAGDFKLAEQEVAAAEKELPDPKPAEEQAYLLIQRGQIYRKSDRAAEAIPLFLQARDIVVAKYGAKDFRLAAIYGSLATTYHQLEKYQDAATAVKSAFSYMQLDEKKAAPSFFNSVMILVVPLRGKLGNGPLVIDMLTAAEDSLDRLNLSQSSDAAYMKYFLGDGLRYERKYKESEAKFRSASEIFAIKKMDEMVIDARSNLADVMESQGRYADANQEFTAALATAESAFGPKSAQYAKVLQRQGRLYVSWGKLAEAEAKLRQAIQVLEKDPNSVELAGCWGGLASILLNQKKLAEAEDAFRKQMAIAEKSTTIVPEDRANSCAALAMFLMTQNKYVEAEAILKKALEQAQQQVKESPLVAEQYSTLGLLHYAQGNYKEAAEYNQKSLDMRRKLLGNDSRLVAESLHNAASLFRDQRQFAQAEANYAESLRIMKSVAGPDDIVIIRMLINWATCQNMQARYSGSEQLLLEAKAIAEKAYGKDDKDVITFTEKLGENSLDAGKYADAETKLTEALALREKGDGPNSISVARILNLLIRTYNESGNTAKAQVLQSRVDTIKEKLPGALPPEFAKSAVVSTSRDLVRPTKVVANKWAVVIGISNFKDPSINLKYAAKDAKDFAKFLTTEGNFSSDHVKLLVDQDATRGNITDALGDGWLGKKARSNDVVVIYVSSHGGTDTTNETGGVNFLCAHESNAHNLLMTGIPMNWFSGMIRQQIPSERVVVFLDVCHSGAAAGDKGLSRESNFDLTRFTPGTGQIIIASSLASQLSWESKQYENGVFTRRLIDSLRTNGGRTPLSEAFVQMKRNVEDEVLDDRQERQTPVMKRTWNGDDLQLAAPLEVDPGTSASQPPASSSPGSSSSAPTSYTSAPTTYSSAPTTYSSPQSAADPPPTPPASTPLPKPLPPTQPVKAPVPGSADDF